MQSDEKEALIKLLIDNKSFESLSRFTDRVNLFNILKMRYTEIRHSNVLAWLLDSSENHMLGNYFIKSLIKKIIEINEEYFSYNQFNVFKLLLSDLSSYTVYREQLKIDILLISSEEKMLIAIENKIHAKEGRNQLRDYREKLITKYPDYKMILIFLTPEGYEGADSEEGNNYWINVGYEIIADILTNIQFEKPNMPDEVKLIIKNYYQIIKEDIMEDNGELKELCLKIYKQHKTAIDLIVKYMPNSSDYSEHIKQILLERKDTIGDIIFYPEFSNNCYIRFTSPTIEKLIPRKLTPAQAGWKNGYSFMYEIVVHKDEIHLIGTLCSAETEMADINNHAVMIALENKKELGFKSKMTKEWLFTRIFRRNLLQFKDYDDDTETIKSEMTKCINKVISKDIKNFEKILSDNWKL